MPFAISRQNYFDRNRQLAVEISDGLKQASKDILPVRYKGEGKNFLDPRDAARNAVLVHKQWITFNAPGENIELNINFPNGGRYWFNDQGIRALNTWAEKLFLSMEKCDSCSKLLPKKGGVELSGFPGRFCTEVCCSNLYRLIFKREPTFPAPTKK